MTDEIFDAAISELAERTIDRLRAELAAMKGFRDECERQYQEKVAELAAARDKVRRAYVQLEASDKANTALAAELAAERERLVEECAEIVEDLTMQSGMCDGVTAVKRIRAVLKEAGMSEDIVARLREHISIQEWPTLQDNAADEIEALMAERDVERKWRLIANYERKRAVAAEARAERAEAALREIYQIDESGSDTYRLSVCREKARAVLAQIEKETGHE